MNYIASYRMRYESCCARLYVVQVRPGCAFVLEWKLPFRNPGSTTGKYVCTYVAMHIVLHTVVIIYHLVVLVALLYLAQHLLNQ